MQNGKRCSVNIEDGVELGVENSIAPVINYDDKVEQVYLDYNGKGVYSFDSDDSNSPWYGPRELSTLKFDEANGQIISYSLQRKGSLFSRAVNLKCKF